MSGTIIIAGGGPAGAAAAARLARAGKAVTVFEREAEPAHKICGEFLSVEARDSLASIGFDVASLGGHAISRLRLIRDADAVSVALPFRGLGVSRLKLDAALLDHAAASGATVRRGINVRGVDCTNGIHLDIGDGEPLHAQTLILATGKHDVRGLRRTTATPEDLVGFKMYFRLGPEARSALSGHVELFLFADGYAGLQLVEDGSANLCLLVDRARLKRTGGHWDGLLDDLLARNAMLAARFAGAVPLFDQPLSIFRVPYGFVHAPRTDDPPCVFRLGDQAGVIQSFTGDGMAIALHSARLAAEAILAGTSARAFHRRLRRDIAGQISRASLLYRAVRSPPAQRALFGLARVFPGFLSLAARYTRVPHHAR